MSVYREPGRPRDPLPTMPDDVTRYESRFLREAVRRAKTMMWIRRVLIAAFFIVAVAIVVLAIVVANQDEANCERRGGVMLKTSSGYQCVRAERLDR